MSPKESQSPPSNSLQGARLMGGIGVKNYFGNADVMLHQGTSLSLGLQVLVAHLKGGVHHGERDVEKVWSAKPALPDYKNYTSLKNCVCSP